MKVLGMDSPHCAMTVESALKSYRALKTLILIFQISAQNYFDSSLLNIGDIFKVITDAGYKPIEEEGEAEEILDKEKFERRSNKNHETQACDWRYSFIFIFLGSFPQWFSFVPQVLNSNWVLLILTTPVQFWVGYQFYSGLKLIKYRTADMNTLIAIGTLAAYFYSVAVTIFPVFAREGLMPATYFDTSAIIIVLIL